MSIMLIEVMKSKIQRVKVTQAELHYDRADASSREPIVVFPGDHKKLIAA